MNHLRWKEAGVFRGYRKAFSAFAEALVSNMKKNLDLVLGLETELEPVIEFL